MTALLPSMIFRLPVAVEPERTSPEAIAIAGAAATPLTSEQRQRLAIAARRAFDAQAALGLVAEATFDDWRHARVREATGRGGLRELTQRTYGSMMARFIELAGGTPRRRDWKAAAKPAHRDDASRARHALKAECAARSEAFGGPDQANAYATTLLARIHKTDWMSASARQLWQVLFTVRNRARAKTRRNAPVRPSGSGGGDDAPGRGEAASPAFPAPCRPCHES